MPDQLVEIVEYDPGWPDKFAIQRGRVTAVLGPWLASPVEHIGSTSVPGLSAKPVIDMLAPVRSLQVAHDAVGVL
ncbi:MAG TPA: GrpB family protein, partial [Streptosporangiaceae bacterium]